MATNNVSVTGARLTVDRYSDQIAELFQLAASQAQWSEIPQYQVVISPIGLQLVTVRDKLFTEGLRVCNNLLCIRFPCRLRSLKESSGDTRNGLDDKKLISYLITIS